MVGTEKDTEHDPLEYMRQLRSELGELTRQRDRAAARLAAIKAEMTAQRYAIDKERRRLATCGVIDDTADGLQLEGQRMRMRRRRLKLSIQEVATRAGVSRQALSQFERHGTSLATQTVRDIWGILEAVEAGQG